MDLDGFMKILPFFNAAGLPLLAIAIMLLLRAYQQSVKTYQESSTYLSEENKKLRALLAEGDANYFSLMEKVKGIVAKSTEAIGELQGRKISLLSKAEGAVDEETLNDMEKINEAISLMQRLSEVGSRIELDYKREQIYLREHILSLTNDIGRIAEQIGDMKSRTAIVGVVVSDETYNQLKSAIGARERGSVIPQEPSRTLPKRDAKTDEAADDRENVCLRLSGASGEEAAEKPAKE